MGSIREAWLHVLCVLPCGIFIVSKINIESRLINFFKYCILYFTKLCSISIIATIKMFIGLNSERVIGQVIIPLNAVRGWFIMPWPYDCFTKNPTHLKSTTISFTNVHIQLLALGLHFTEPTSLNIYFTELTEPKIGV